MKQNKYTRGKEKTRSAAVEWQIENAKRDLCYAEICEISAHFEKLGRRFGLLRELRENGVI